MAESPWRPPVPPARTPEKTAHPRVAAVAPFESSAARPAEVRAGNPAPERPRRVRRHPEAPSDRPPPGESFCHNPRPAELDRVGARADTAWRHPVDKMAVAEYPRSADKPVPLDKPPESMDTAASPARRRRYSDSLAPSDRRRNIPAARVDLPPVFALLPPEEMKAAGDRFPPTAGACCDPPPAPWQPASCWLAAAKMAYSRNRPPTESRPTFPKPASNSRSSILPVRSATLTRDPNRLAKLSLV